MKRPMLGAAALATAGALTTLTFAPAFATHTVAQADASALKLAIAGSPADSGTVTASHDGTSLSKAGDSEPPIALLGGQDLLDIGVLAQDATARVEGQDGVSEACSGVAGQGGSVASIGESSCIVPGEAIGVNLANLDLTGVDVIVPGSALDPLTAVTGPLGELVLGPITQQLSDALTEALGPLNDINIGGGIGAVEARCQAVPGSATGNAHIVDGKLGITLAGQDVAVLDLPVNPAPNTHVLTDLSAVLDAVIVGLETELNTALDGALSGLTGVTDAVQEAIVQGIITEIEPQLAPLEENILDITLNKQDRNGPGHIEVTAIDLKVLPAAQEFIGGSVVDAQIANVSCGPNSRIHPPVTPEEPGQPEPEVPTVVNSGLEGGAPADEEAGKALVAGGLLALGGAAGALGYRRFAAK